MVKKSMVKKSSSSKRVSAKSAAKSEAARAVIAKKAGGNVSKAAASMEQLRGYVRQHAARWLEDPNITSVGIGHKQVDGTTTPTVCIQFTVGAKAAPEEMQALGTEPIPRTLVIDGVAVPTDVIERSFRPSYKLLEMQSKDVRRARVETLQPGISVGSVRTTAGTLGAFVRDRRSKKIVLLSNWHVLHGPGGKLGDGVVQPGRHDDNRVENNLIGKLLRSHLGAAGDCAIASVSGRGVSAEVLGLQVPVSSVGDPQLGDRVVKSGRTTAVTYGVVTRIEVNTRLNYGDGISAAIGGFEIGPDATQPARDGEISRGGDSGSAWLAVDKKGKPSSVMLGLHFAGDADGTVAEFALACYAGSVMTALEIEPAGMVKAVASESDEAADLRTGFDQDFLGFPVALPRFTAQRRKDLAALDGDAELRYCHFSVWLSRMRKYPVCVGWNIDGSQFKRLNRGSFRVDRRGDLEDYQLTNAIYENNPFDRGHVARRADLCWGSMEEAQQGNYDSFYFTNIAPQHEAFNQSDNTDSDAQGGLWGRLENAVFDSEQPHQLRVSLFGGPVFGKNDRRFEQAGQTCLIPDQYWKLVAYTDDRDNKEKVFAFLLTQPALIKNLTKPQGIDLAPWVWARISLRDLQELTGIRFASALHRREVPFVTTQTSTTDLQLKPLWSAREYFLS